jgi:hypothetical protein
MGLQIQRDLNLLGFFVLVVVVDEIVVMFVRQRVGIIQDGFIERFIQWLQMSNFNICNFE